ncbi:type II toxin-antitoxin system HicA family toxin [Comamonas thiooxydans]|uniref:type II toxin-antitoxin system HicA family toxin n=1 Tax=Comamonas thiooxydans TaxID=363952 RepID=UPI003C7E6307
MLASSKHFCLYSHHRNKRKVVVKISEFKRWLEAQGVRVENGTNHWRLYHNGNTSTLPRHPSKELKEGTRRAILKQLGIN